MAEKTENPIQLRLPADLLREVRRLAARHHRPITWEITYLVYLGAHVEQFQPGILIGNGDESQE